jgi:flavodoxin
MTAPVLVAYATQYGSTEEVAERATETLRHHASSTFPVAFCFGPGG